jgi:hypothetical protein
LCNHNFAVEDYRGFDISEGIEGNPTIDAISGYGNNK